MKWNPISLELSFNRALYSHATLIVITLNSSWGNKIGKSTKKEKRCYLSGFSYFDRSHVSACSSKRQESLTNKRDSPFLTSSSSSDNVRNWRCLHQMENGHADKNLGDNARPYGVHDCVYTTGIYELHLLIKLNKKRETRSTKHLKKWRIT